MFVKILNVCILWSIGYALTWISKWTVCDLALGTSIIKSAFEQLRYRTIEIHINIIVFIKLFIDHILLSIAIMIYFFVFYIFTHPFSQNAKAQTNKQDTLINNRFILLLICAIPLLFSMITFNHFCVHSFITYRNFEMIYMFLLLLLFEEKKLV